MTETRARTFAGVGLTAAAMLLAELFVTRLFSVVFFYHYSFFAVSLVMSGLALGGIVAARFPGPTSATGRGESALCLAASVLLAAALIPLLGYPFSRGTPALTHAILIAGGFAPALTCAGAFLARAFARAGAGIGPLYAFDLVAAGAACAAAIPLSRLVPGPATILLPALLLATASYALYPGGWRRRATVAAWGLLLLAGVAASVASSGKALRLRLPPSKIERWNEHSLIRFNTNSRGGGVLVIDRTAATSVPTVRPRPAGAPVPLWPAFARAAPYLAYDTGRPIESVAIIGVGGGRDVLAALARGATRVDGYEINRIIVSLHRRELLERSRIAAWPEVTLVPEEGRVGIRRSGRTYDVIQASCIDTWAATQSGGLVLSENGLYTREAWRTFLQALTPRGVLTMTRWYVPRAPAEVERLLSLAVAALEDVGITRPDGHILLAVPADAAGDKHGLATIVVSRAPFSRREARALRGACQDLRMVRLVAPATAAPAGDGAPEEGTLQALLDPARRQDAIRSSPFDISPPTDMRPYFFLQLRPWQALFRRSEGFVLDITFRAVELLALLVVSSFGLAGATLAFGLLTARGSVPPAAIGRYRALTLYFLGIGLGYMLVQLGLHQRLILVLGHPTRALAVVLLSMLWGTGLGSYASSRLFREPRTFPAAWIAILAAIGGAVAAVGRASLLEDASAPVRDATVASAVGLVGFVLGFAFPLGVRLAEAAGPGAVARLWAVNGAASIAGSALAAVIGLSFGSRAVLAAGLACYALVAAAGTVASRR